MIKNIVKKLMCEDERLRQLMDIHIPDILRYRDMADMVDPEDALRFLADRFIDNCGISLGMRGFYDYCAGYWEEKLDLENNPALNENTMALKLSHNSFPISLTNITRTCLMSLIPVL